MAASTANPPLPRRRGSDSERLDDQTRRGSPRVLLLARNKKSVANCVRFEPGRDDEVGAIELLRFVLDPEGLDPLADKLVGVVLLRVREPGPGLPLDQHAPVGKPRLEQRAGRVT